MANPQGTNFIFQNLSTRGNRVPHPRQPDKFIFEDRIGSELKKVYGRLVFENQVLFYDPLWSKGKSLVEINSEIKKRLQDYKTRQFLNNITFLPWLIRPIIYFLIKLVPNLFSKTTRFETEKLVDEKSKCCHNNLILISNTEAYKLIAKSINSKGNNISSYLKSKGFELNDVVYNNMATEDGNPNLDDIPPDLEREGHSRYWSDAYPEPIDCENIVALPFQESQKKIGIGVIDFGFQDPHGHFILQILKKTVGANDDIGFFDYNLVETTGNASLHSLCCQIERGILDKIDILNISMGYYSESKEPTNILSDHINRAYDAGIKIICSAGNASSDNSVLAHWPSNMAKCVLAIGAYKNKPLKSSTIEAAHYSNRGKLVTGYETGSFLINVTPFGSSSSSSTAPSLEIVAGTSFSAASISAKVGLHYAGQNIDIVELKNKLVNDNHLKLIP